MDVAAAWPTTGKQSGKSILKITVYSLPENQCPQCKFTKRKLDDLGLPYEVVEVSDDPAAVKLIREMGFSSAPVVVVDFGDDASWSWQGFSPSRIEQMVARLDEISVLAS